MEKVSPFLRVSIYNWHFYPRMIDWKIKNRDSISHDNDLKNTINVSILIDLTTYIEGLLCNIILKILTKKQTDQNERITKHLTDTISDLTWSKYNEYFALIFGNKIFEITNDENYKAVNLLFTFRNILVHANDLKINYFYDKNRNEDYYSDIPKFNNIINFLREKKLIDWSMSKFKDNDHFNYLIKDNIVDFFYTKSKDFLKEIFNNLPDDEKTEFKFHFPEYFND